ncbi:flagellar motor switch protein FliM [Cellulomonas bogoriensis]|uniref:Flagellar motor switch protein FliM n=1 Tax=Cellulomonas bogoriensis 69B4 = DSM 16987 TaxID=1386082 RepID=A0A0A0BQF9_9CELL|nr:flagellar motor switch protein FliM [Cellulomonas bogoriensis]KGM09319.1 flagellar motor switch protein FliM [Cellulomonas bogoriensis 69B4 = DSM 16987]
MTVQDTAAPTSRRKRSAEPETYDFRRPMTLAREHGRALEMAFETYARQWGTQLTSRLRVVAQVNLDTVEMRSYDEYVRSLPAMTTMVLCALDQGRSTSALQMPLDTTMVWIDYLLGGPGLSTGDSDRELTEIEWHLLKDLLQHALADLTYAFASVCPLDVTVRSVQYNPQFVQAVAASEPVIIASFDLNVAGKESSATMMMPADVLLAALEAGEELDNRSLEEVREQELAEARLAEQVHDVPVSVAVQFSPRVVPASEIADLQVGDLLTLRHRSDKPLDVVVGDVPLARAALGSNGSRLACLVVASEEKP